MHTRVGREKAIALLTAREIFDLVRDDLVQVEQELTRQTSSGLEPVFIMTSYLWRGGGKLLGGRLALHAVVPDGTGGTKVSDAGYFDRPHAKNGGRRADSARENRAHR